VALDQPPLPRSLFLLGHQWIRELVDLLRRHLGCFGRTFAAPAGLRMSYERDHRYPASRA